MNKVILIPDSFKGTLSSTQICSILSAEIKKRFPHCKIVLIPVADGGEGSVDCFLTALGGKKLYAKVKGPLLEDMDACYGLLNNNASTVDAKLTAVIEMAACAGLPLVEHKKDPLNATTYGVGQLILAAAKQGAQKIIVGLGGSCTTDGGCGAAAAVGVKFFDKQGREFIPTGGSLSDIAHIDTSSVDPLINQTEILAMCDIDNPMHGPTGAAYVFAPQKGATPEIVKVLDNGLKHLDTVLQRDLGLKVSNVPGSGAAGALGAGMMAFFGAQLQMGIDAVLDTVNFSDTLVDTDYVFTGEGKLDSQSLRGKVVIGVARRAKQAHVPVIALVGGVESNIEAAYDMGVTAVFPINRLPEDFSVSKYKSAENLAATAADVLRLLH